MSTADALRCWLCNRPLGRWVEHHHPVPNSRGGRTTVPIHPICHRTLHKSLGNKELERVGADVATLREREDIACFLARVAPKPPDSMHRRVRSAEPARAQKVLPDPPVPGCTSPDWRSPAQTQGDSMADAAGPHHLPMTPGGSSG